MALREFVVNALIAPLYAAGWLAGQLIRLLAICRHAVALGFREARGEHLE